MGNSAITAGDLIKTDKIEYSALAHTVDEQITALTEGLNRLREAETAYYGVSNEIAETTESNSEALKNLTGGYYTAVEERRKGMEAEQKRQERLARLEEQKIENAELYKQLRADAKYSYDMGVIDAGEYYSQLAALRDT